MKVGQATPSETRTAIAKAREAFLDFRNVPAPKRGELIRQMREAIANQVSIRMIQYSLAFY
jgi:aldehyde dehydrogenase family 7 protein A1